MELKQTRHLGGQHPELAELLSRIERTPKQHTVKGMYVAGLWDALDVRGVTPAGPRIQKFKDYPMAEFMQLVLDAAVTLFPGRTPNDGLRALGRLAIPTFAASIVGSVIMGSVGRSWSLALRWLSKGYEVSLTPGRAMSVPLGPARAVVQLRDVWNFPESYHVGVVEGLMEWCDIVGTVSATPLSPSDCDIGVDWTVMDASRRSYAPSASRP